MKVQAKAKVISALIVDDDRDQHYNRRYCRDHVSSVHQSHALRWTLTLAVVMFYAWMTPFCNGLIDVRHQYYMTLLPEEVRDEIYQECTPMFEKYFAKKLRATKKALDSDECPSQVQNCIYEKASGFLERCRYSCGGTPAAPDFNFTCWSDDCFKRSTAVCGQKFARSLKSKPEATDEFECTEEVIHCYNLACMSCLGRKCDIECRGDGVHWIGHTEPTWRGKKEYRMFFLENEPDRLTDEQRSGYADIE